MVAKNKITKPLLAIVGTTATGKSQLALKLAAKFSGEIVSADSWVVRRGLDIGTAKPSLKDRQTVRHHMIDIIEPDDNFSAAEYKKRAAAAIEGIYSRNHLPIIVGGSGLYVDSLLFDYSFLPASGRGERERLNALPLQDLQLLALDEELDLDSIDKNNKRRVIRLIETNGGIATRTSLRDSTLIIGLNPERKELTKSITKRVDQMLAQGLEGEVKNLSEEYGWGCEALKGIGYHEWRLYFTSNQDLTTTRERIIKDTLDLAKRQQSWFKRNKSIHWFTTPVNLSQVDALITTFLSKNVSV